MVYCLAYLDLIAMLGLADVFFPFGCWVSAGNGEAQIYRPPIVLHAAELSLIELTLRCNSRFETISLGGWTRSLGLPWADGQR